MTENETNQELNEQMPKMKEILGTRIGMYFSNKWNGLKNSLIIPSEILDAKHDYKEAKRDESIINKVEKISDKTVKKSTEKLVKEKKIMTLKEQLADNKDDLYSNTAEHEETMLETAGTTLKSLEGTIKKQTKRYTAEAAIGQREIEYEGNQMNGEAVQNEIRNNRNAQRYVNERNRGNQSIISKVYHNAINAVRGLSFVNRGGPVNSDQVRAAQEAIVIPRNGNSGPSNLNQLYDENATAMRNSYRTQVVAGVEAVRERQKADLEEKIAKISERQNRS